MHPIYRHILKGLACTVAGLTFASAQAQQAGPTSATLNAVKARGTLNCGVIGSAPNFSLPDSRGVMQGMDADLCRAVAAATLGDASKVRFVSLTPAQRLVAVQSGEVDVAFALITWTLTRETKSGVQFTGIYFYDAWGTMVPKAAGVNSTKRLDGASLCMIGGPGETNSAEYFGQLGVKYSPVPFSNGEQMRQAFLAKRCDGIFHSLAALASFRGTLGPKADEYLLLPELWGREPLSGAVRKGDDRWFDIVRYTLSAMIAAEELKITTANVATFGATKNPEIRRLLGMDSDLGPSMGLERDWAAKIVGQVGNYAEVFDRNLKPTGLPRGQNALVSDGGLMFALPMR